MLRVLAVTTIAVLVSACSSEPQVEIEQALGAISQESFDATTHFLADDNLKGRATASPEYLIAANYVADRFAEIGLQPGGDDGWFQEVPFITAAIDAENSGVILHTAAGDHELECEYLVKLWSPVVAAVRLTWKQ